MHGAAALGLAISFSSIREAAAESELIERRVLFDNPEYLNVQISPDGEHLAYLAPLNGVRNFWVAPIGDPKNGEPLTGAERSGRRAATSSGGV
ncbi:MAG TPA: hypothetical protein VHW90_11010 [Stellaceae bacterium]|nr:hypothetical protein [Stellaceae bacterium]